MVTDFDEVENALRAFLDDVVEQQGSIAAYAP
jgi:hypothetical protein